MAGKVLNIKVCSPLKLRSGLTEKCHAICHYSYNLPLNTISKFKKKTNMRLSNNQIAEIVLHAFHKAYDEKKTKANLKKTTPYVHLILSV